MVRPVPPEEVTYAVQAIQRGTDPDADAATRGDPDPGLEPFGLLASAIAGRALRVTAGRPGAPAWTDGHVIFVDPGAGGAMRVESIATQAALLAAGSLAPELVRRLRGRPRLARRYLALEGRRALAAVADYLPAVVRGRGDAHTADRDDTPFDSLARARSRERIGEPPASFGTIRVARLLAAGDLDEFAGEASPELPRTPGEVLAELDEDAGDGIGLTDEFSNADGSGGPLGRLFGRLMAFVRTIEGGTPPGAETAMRRAAGPLSGRARTPLTTHAAGGVEDTPSFRTRTRIYPEWDAGRRRYKNDWCTVNELDVSLLDTEPGLATDRHGLRRPLARLGMGLDRFHRQTQGDDLDIDAAIEARLEAIAGSAPDEAVYVDSLRRRRDLAVLVLLDISGSAGEPTATGETVHEQQRAVASSLTAALNEIGDRVALYAFQSQGRSSVSVLPVKRFDEGLGARTLQRLHSLVPGAYSRLGAAIRHGTTLLEEGAGTPRRLLVVLSDGLAYDHGYEPAYGAADARRALAEARRQGVGCLCLSIGTSTDSAALRRVFGSAAHATIPLPAQLGRTVGPLFRSAIRSADVRRRVTGI